MKEISILDIIKYYLKNLEVVLIITVLSLLISLFYIEKKFIPIYKESTTIILGKSNNNENEEISSSTITLYDSLINNYIKILKSKKLLTNVKSDLNLIYSINELSKKIEYSVSDNSQLIEISVTDKDDSLAVEICNQLVKELQDQIYEIYGIKNITIVDEAKANNNQVYTQSFIIILFTILGFFISSFCIIMKFIFASKLSIQNIDQVSQVNYFGKVTNYKLKNTCDFELNLSEKIVNEFRMIRSKLLETFNDKKTIMITSMNKNNSKSYVTYHLANYLSKINKKVLVIDANKQDGVMSEKFFKDKEGIIDGLSQKKELLELVQKINQFDIIPLGNKEKIDLLSSSELKHELEKLKQNYDYILIETPVYKNNFESIDILKITDAILIINNKSNLDDLKLITQKLEQKEVGIINVQEKNKKTEKKPKEINFKKKIKLEKKEKLTMIDSKQENLTQTDLKVRKKTVSKPQAGNSIKNNNLSTLKETKKTVGVNKNEKRKKAIK